MENNQFGGVDTFCATLLNNWPENDSFVLICNKTHPGHEQLRQSLSSVSEFKIVDILTVGTKASSPLESRIGSLHEALYELIGSFNPHLIAIESVFVGNNSQSALKIGQTRGALIAAAYRHKVKITSNDISIL